MKEDEGEKGRRGKREVRKGGKRKGQKKKRA
jgi:hypothetical protein